MKNVFGIPLLLLLRLGWCSSLLVTGPRQTIRLCPYHSRRFALQAAPDQQQQQDGDGGTSPPSFSPSSRTIPPAGNRPSQSKPYIKSKFTGSNNNNNNNNNQHPRRQVASSGGLRQQRTIENFMRDFSNGEEIRTWMNDKVREQKLGGPSPFPPTWSSRDETDFIRALRDMGAYQALELFVYHFARKNIFVFTAAISAMAKSRDANIRARALIVLDKMDKTGVLPSSFTFAALFQSVDGPEKAKQLMVRLQQTYKGKVSFSVDSFNQAIIACSRRIPGRHPSNKSWQVALDLAQSMRREGLRPNLWTYISLLNVCAQTGQVRIAMSLFREIESNPDLTPNSRVYVSLLNVCAQAGDYVLANNVLKTMQENGIIINLFHCSAFLKALSRNGKVDMCLQVLDMMTGITAQPSNQTAKVGAFQMTEFPRITPDLVALNTILKSCAQAYRFDAARKLVDRMRAGEFSTTSTSQVIYPDEISYSLLLSCCSVPLIARAIIKEMQMSRRKRVGVVRPSSITYARAIAVCRRAQAPDVESARFFLDSARKNGVEPTIFMYSAAIWTAERSGNYSVAKDFLHEMQDQGISANSISYTGVIAAAAKNAQVEEAIALWEEMKVRGCVPTGATYNALSLSIRNSQVPDKRKKLEYIFDKFDLSDRYVEVGGLIMEALINEYCTMGAYDDAKRVFDMIQGACNGQCLRAILFACARAHPAPRWEEAVSILHCSDITSSATGPGEMDQGALGNAIIACARADRWEEGLNLLQLYGVRAPRRSRSIAVGALNALMASAGRNGRADTAINILNDMHRYGVKPDGRSYRSVIVACNQAEHQKRRYQLASYSSNTTNAAEKQTEPTFQWWEASLALLRRMREEGLQPDIQTFSSCISACEAAGQWQRALTTLQSMIDTPGKDETEFLNLFCFNAAISSCEKGGAWVEALEIYERMISYGGLLKPNFVTLSSLVLALANAGQKELAESKYMEGVKMKIVNPWRKTKDSLGRPVRGMDLHKFNSALASCAVKSFLDSMLKRGKEKAIEDDFIIIVGKGLRSEEKPVLLPALQELLLSEYGLAIDAAEENAGRLVIKAETLRSIVAGRSW